MMVIAFGEVPLIKLHACPVNFGSLLIIGPVDSFISSYQERLLTVVRRNLLQRGCFLRRLSMR